MKQLSTPFDFHCNKASHAVFRMIQRTAISEDLPPQRQCMAASVATRRQDIAAWIRQLFIKEPT
ncbi:MAG: hypothetical protein ACLP2F_01165 [Steroidobacteraceae bacterium]